jgi:hypothetical protein
LDIAEPKIRSSELVQQVLKCRSISGTSIATTSSGQTLPSRPASRDIDICIVVVVIHQ